MEKQKMPYGHRSEFGDTFTIKQLTNGIVEKQILPLIQATAREFASQTVFLGHYPEFAMVHPDVCKCLPDEVTVTVEIKEQGSRRYKKNFTIPIYGNKLMSYHGSVMVGFYD